MHPLPAVRLVAPQRGQMVLYLRPRMEHVRHRGNLPIMPSPMDFNPVSLLHPLVAAFGLVYEVTCWYLRSTESGN